MKSKQVSVVIPCYNVEKYVSKCLDSVINQTFKEIEIIVVNDGSTDNTLRILKEYKKRDERIVLVDKKNGGLSDARNVGIAKSNSEYICFVDSDDFLDERYIELLYNEMIKTNSDIVACDYNYIDEVGNTWTIKNKKHTFYNNIDAIKDFLSCEQNLEVVAWNKLYKKSLFVDNNILFPKGKIHEDNFTTYKLLYYAKKISLIPNRLYFYLQRKNSIMGTKFNKKRLDILDAVNDTKRFFEKNHIEIDIKNYIDCYEASIYITLVNNILKSNYDGDEKNNIFSYLKRNNKKYIKNKYISTKIKIKIILFSYFLDIYIKLIKCKSR